MQVRLILSIGLILCISALTYGYTDCGSKDGALVSVSISGCNIEKDSNKRCILKRNTNVTMELSFSSNVDTDSLQAVVHGIILGVPWPFDLPNSDGCKDSGINCPVKGGQTYKYITTMPILGSYPRVTVDIKWELQDKDQNDVICAMIPSKIG